MKDIFSMPFSDGCELIEYALDAEEEDKQFLRWAIMYQTDMDFDEFKKKIGCGDREENSQTAADILKSVKSIIG